MSKLSEISNDNGLTKEAVLANSGDNPYLGKGFPLQGLKNNALVAGKTTALKLFYSYDNAMASTQVRVHISGPRNYEKFIWWNREWDDTNHWDPFYNKFQIFYYRLNQPYLVGRIKGSDVPYVGGYHFSCDVIDSSSQVIQTIHINQEFLPTKDLCVIVSRVWGQPITWEEIYETHRAMLRFSTLMPIRDGLGYLDGGNRTAGLRYDCDFNPYPGDSALGQFYENYLRRPHYDPIHLGIAYRFPDVGEASCGNSGHWYGNIPFSLSVFIPPLASVFGQETGHILGLEPENSPYFDGGGHSKQQYISPTDVAGGFDIQYNRPFPQPVFDIMNGIKNSKGQPDDRFSFHSWDWEFLRQRLLRYNSTGPT